MSKKIVKTKTFEERLKEKGGFIVITGTEPCYTCGHKKQLVYPEKTDGRVDIKYKCLFCMVRINTAANRSGV